ncbi:putative lateral flagellar export/assembly protein LafU [Escherichia coli]|nr:putative lateral flagellar export/assembly protein LafU [Escherichia coli]
MNPALLATLGTLAETASLKADILPPVSGENAPAFTLPKMAVAAVAERVHSAKTSQQQATRPQENDPVAMQALMALLLPQPAAPHQDTPQPRNVATSPVIQQLTKAVVQNAPQRPEQQQELTPLPPQLQELISQLPQAKPEQQARLATYASEDLHAIAPTQPRVSTQPARPKPELTRVTARPQVERKTEKVPDSEPVIARAVLSPLNKISPSHPPKPATVAVPEETEKKARDVNEKTALLKKKSATELGELATSITTIARDAHMEANLEMEIVPQGLRVLIKDDQNRNMFERGSAQIMPFFKTLLVELAPVFDSLDNKIIITGHTDAMAYKNNIYNNWNLSGDRALSARRVLEEAGMPEDKVMQVSAMADQMLLDSKNPQSAGNRRIEIMVLTKSASDTLYQYFGQHGDKVVQPLVQKLDKQQVLSQRTR